MFIDSFASLGAELKIMSAVECKEPGFYRDFDEKTDPGDDFGVETSEFKSGDECSYALGKQGATRKKLEAGLQIECECVLTQ